MMTKRLSGQKLQKRCDYAIDVGVEYLCEMKTNHKIVCLVVEKHLNFKSYMYMMEGEN